MSLAYEVLRFIDRTQRAADKPKAPPRCRECGAPRELAAKSCRYCRTDHLTEVAGTK